MPTTRPLQEDWYDYPQYYDIAFRSDTRLEADFIVAACRKYCPFPARRLLEPACGTGRLVAELAGRGYRLAGFDLNPSALGYVRRRLARRGLRRGSSRPTWPISALAGRWTPPIARSTRSGTC